MNLLMIIYQDRLILQALGATFLRNRFRFLRFLRHFPQNH